MYDKNKIGATMLHLSLWDPELGAHTIEQD